MSEVHLSSEPNANPADIAHIEDSINEFNMQYTGDRNYHPVNIFLRDTAGSLRGGILADVWGGWMHIRFLWVDADIRGADYGTELVQAAEAEARAFGCHHAHVETFSFQARPFYERLGYETIAMLEDYPAGEQHYILKKVL